MKKIFDSILQKSFWTQCFLLVAILAVAGAGFYFYGIKNPDKVDFTENIEKKIDGISNVSSDLITDHQTKKSETIDTANAKWYVISRLIDPGYVGGSIDKGYSFFITIIGWLICTGLLIAIITNGYFERIKDIENGRTRYNFKDHCVILGSNEITVSLIQQVYSWSEFNKKKPIVIHSEKESKELRAKLKAQLKDTTEKRLYVFRGSRDSKEQLEKLHLHKAKLVIVIGEEGETGIDSGNVECVNIISKILSEKSKKANRLCCYLYLENQTTFTLLQQIDINDSVRRCIDLHIFNLHEGWANLILTGKNERTDETDYYKLDYKPITAENDNYMRFVIVGFNRMGKAFAIQTARLAHFGNTKPSVITVIDENAEELKDEFLSQYPGHANMNENIQFEFIQSRIESNEIRQNIQDWTNDEKQVLSIAICFRNPDASMYVGLNLPNAVYSKNIPILIRQEVLHGFASTMRQDERYNHVRFFGMLSEACNLEFDRDKEARKIHAGYLEAIKKEGKFNNTELSHQDWGNLEEQYRWSNRYAADILPVKKSVLVNTSLMLKYFGYNFKEYAKLAKAVFYKHYINADNEIKAFCNTRPELYNEIISVIEENNISEKQYKTVLDDIERISLIEHNRWMAERILAGWQYGKKRNKFERLHPDLIAYNILSESIKMYDRKPSVEMLERL